MRHGRTPGAENTWEPYPRASLASVDPHARLAVAIFAQAVKDARAGERDALIWLAGDACSLYCEILGFDRETVYDYVDLWAQTPESKPARAGRLVIRMTAGPELAGLGV